MIRTCPNFMECHFMDIHTYTHTYHVPPLAVPHEHVSSVTRCWCSWKLSLAVHWTHLDPHPLLVAKANGGERTYCDQIARVHSPHSSPALAWDTGVVSGVLCEQSLRCLRWSLVNRVGCYLYTGEQGSASPRL